MDYKRSILEYCNKLGLDTVGFSRCRMFEELKKYFEARKAEGLENEFEEKDIERRINPFLYMEDGKTIISIAFPYYFSLESKNSSVFSNYTFGRDYHYIVSKYLMDICNHIIGLGGKAIYFVDSNSLPERYIAQQSGVGFIGKNNTLITKKYGSYVFLGEIITNIDIESDIPLGNGCGSCDLCEYVCPTKSISCKSDPNICLSYITQKKEIEEQWFEKLRGRVFGCDTCQKVCPYNKDVETSNIEEFKPYDFMEYANIEELICLDKKTFVEKFSKTSCGWRGKNVLQRNALINYMCTERNKKFSQFSSPYVQNYYEKLLKYLKL